MSEVLRIMPLGDSFTFGQIDDEDESQGYGGYRRKLNRLLSDNGYEHEFVGSLRHGSFENNACEGHKGWVCDYSVIRAEPYNVSGLAQHLESWMSASRPDVVLLCIGINDLCTGFNVSEQDAIDAQHKLLKRMFSLNENLKALVTLAPAWDELLGLNNALPTVINKLSEEGFSAYLFDAFQGFNPSKEEQVHIHKNHPNAAGYDIMAENWFSAMKKYIFT